MESELQFVYDGEGPLVVPTRLCDLELRRSSAFSVSDTYYDTVALELRRRGCSLRVRQAESAGPRLTLKGPSRKRTRGKRRYELEIKIGKLPPQIEEMTGFLRELGLLGELQRIADIGDSPELVAVGVLRNRRSEHRYEHGLHRLDLTWDELEFPTGPPQTRLEIEAASPLAERLLEQAADEVRGLFGRDLVKPERGKVRELCERLYPELLAA